MGDNQLPAKAGYEVGYAKPPTEHRFRKGASGNPSGRPKGAKNKPKGGRYPLRYATAQGVSQDRSVSPCRHT